MMDVLQLQAIRKPIFDALCSIDRAIAEAKKERDKAIENNHLKGTMA